MTFRSDTQSEDSLDGEPIDGETKRKVSPAPPPPAGAFIKSKWETVDPEQVQNLGFLLYMLYQSLAI